MKALTGLAAAILAAASFASHAVGQLADVRIHDRTTGRELPVHWHEGRAYVAGQPGNEYQVTVRNPRREDVLAVVSVDGINAVTGQSANPRQSGYVVGARDRVNVRGWRKGLGETAAFYFTSLGDSYAARTDRPRDVGVIGVALFERKPERHEPPLEIAPRAKREGAADAANAQESSSARRAPAAAAPLGTGHGRRETSQASYVDFERATREPAEIVTIYYDSHANLVAQGVIPTYGRAPRDPSPFPAAFVPDPPRYRR